MPIVALEFVKSTQKISIIQLNNLDKKYLNQVCRYENRLEISYTQNKPCQRKNEK